MPYLMETVEAGGVREITKKYSSRYGRKGIRRDRNHSPTPPDVKAQNERNAEQKLRRLISTNFGIHDLCLYLTDQEADGPGQARQHLARFLRNLRVLYSGSGRELQYIGITEYRNRAAHSLLINAFDFLEIAPLWTYGGFRFCRLEFSEDPMEQLAAVWMQKVKRNDTAVFRKHWNQSRNLKKPEIQVEVLNSGRTKKE